MNRHTRKRIRQSIAAALAVTGRQRAAKLHEAFATMRESDATSVPLSEAQSLSTEDLENLVASWQLATDPPPAAFAVGDVVHHDAMWVHAVGAPARPGRLEVLSRAWTSPYRPWAYTMRGEDGKGYRAPEHNLRRADR